MDEEREVTTEVRDETVAPVEPAVQRQTVRTSRGVGSGVIIARVVYWLTGAIVALLALRVVLLLLGANRASSFVDFVYSLSNVFAQPFYGIFDYQPSYGSSTLELSSIMAIVVYVLVGVGLAKLFTLGSNRANV